MEDDTKCDETKDMMQTTTNINNKNNMEDKDNLSIKSSDSITTSGEYEIVPETPQAATLQVNKVAVTPLSPILTFVAGDMKDMEDSLTDVIRELDVTEKEETRSANPTDSEAATASTTYMRPETLTVNEMCPMKNALITPTAGETGISPNKVGQSVFYDCIDASPMCEPVVSTEGGGRGERSTPSDTENEDISDIHQECTIFSGVTYLGSVGVNSPTSEPEIKQKMSEMNTLSTNTGINVSVSIPNSSDGMVVLYDGQTHAVVATYEVSRIRFFTVGTLDTTDKACFAFTWSHGQSQETTIFQCHIFRCQIPEAVSQVNNCFSKAFSPKLPTSLTTSVTSAACASENQMMSSITSDMTGNPLTQAMYEFNVSLEIREKVNRTYTAVARDKNVFKLRCNMDKEVSIVVKQTASPSLPPLLIERCFGVLLAPGKLVRQADMQLLDMVNMGFLKAQDIGGTQIPQLLAPYQIRAEWKANEKAFEQLNAESAKKYVTVAIDLVIKGISEPVRFVIETLVTILSQNESRLMDNILLSKRPLLQKFYLQLKDNAGNWEVQSIDPSEEIVEQPVSLRNFTKNLSKMTGQMIGRSQSMLDFELDDFSDGEGSPDTDEPLLSGTGEVSRDCSTDCIEQWSVMFQEWETKRPKTLPALVRLGIPEALRGKIWQKLANVEQRSDLTERYKLLIKQETSCETVILNDLNRTFPANKMFQEIGGTAQGQLYQVCKAYAVYDTEVGYCQGLSFISASLLLHMPEEEAFAVLVALMYDYGLREFYKPGFETLTFKLYQLDRLLKDQIPDLYEHFEQNRIETHMFASQWFLTLFTARFPLCFVYHVIDLILLDGLNVLFQVAMTLLYIAKKDLLELDFEGILKYIKVALPKKSRSETQTRKLMRMVCDWKVKKLKKYTDEYYQAKLEEEKQQQDEARFDEERKNFHTEITYLQTRVSNVEKEEQKAKGIIVEYKQIIQRQEHQITKLNTMLEDATKVISSCAKCSAAMPTHSPLHKPSLVNGSEILPDLGPLDPVHELKERIRELELELAKTKLDKVEAECRNQDLTHRLNTVVEMQQKNNWQPWLAKTFTSIQEKVNTTRRDIPTFQAHVPLDTDSPGATSPNFKSKLLQKNSINRQSFDFARLGATNKDIQHTMDET